MPLKGKALGCVSRHSYYLRAISINQNFPLIHMLTKECHR